MVNITTTIAGVDLIVGMDGFIILPRYVGYSYAVIRRSGNRAIYEVLVAITLPGKASRREIVRMVNPNMASKQRRIDDCDVTIWGLTVDGLKDPAQVCSPGAEFCSDIRRPREVPLDHVSEPGDVVDDGRLLSLRLEESEWPHAIFPVQPLITTA